LLGSVTCCTGWAPYWAGFLPAVIAMGCSLLGLRHTADGDAVLYKRTCCLGPMAALWLVNHLESALMVLCLGLQGVATYALIYPMFALRPLQADICVAITMACGVALAVSAAWIKVRLFSLADDAFMNAALAQVRAVPAAQVGSPQGRSIALPLAAAAAAAADPVSVPAPRVASGLQRLLPRQRVGDLDDAPHGNAALCPSQPSNALASLPKVDRRQLPGHVLSAASPTLSRGEESLLFGADAPSPLERSRLPGDDADGDVW